MVTSLHTPLKKVVENNPDWRVHLTPERRHAYEDQVQAEVFVARHAHGIRANSKAVIATMREYYGVNFSEDRLFVLPHGMEDRSALHCARNLADKSTNFIDVLYAGRFEGRKGTDVLLQYLRFAQNTTSALYSGRRRSHPR